MEQNLTRIFTLFGGLALFLYGMDALSHSLETAAGSRLKSLLAAVTGSPVICARCLIADLRNRRSAQMPVPMAVAPRLSWASSGTTRSNAAKSDFNSVANA